MSSTDRGHSRRSKVVHFSDLQLYQGRQEEHMGEPTAGGSVNAPHGQGEDCNGYYQNLVRWSQWSVVR